MSTTLAQRIRISFSFFLASLSTVLLTFTIMVGNVHSLKKIITKIKSSILGQSKS